MENKSKNSKQTILIILVVLLLVIILGLIMYICYDKGLIFSKNNDDIKNPPTKYTENELNNEDDKNSTTNDTNDTEKTENVVIQDLDLSKCLNTSDVTYKNPTDDKNSNIISMNVNADKKSVTLNIDWNTLGNILNDIDDSVKLASYQIKGFSKEIADTFVGKTGQSITSTTLFYLMSDGTVEYTPLFVMKDYKYVLNNQDDSSDIYFITYGAKKDVTDVVKLYNTDAYTIAGWMTTIGAKADGSFYDLATNND